MANTDTVFGARIISRLDGGADFRISTYTVLATDATALFVGDFVTHTGTSGTGQHGQTLPVVTQSAASDVICGVVVGFAVDPTNLYQIYRTASTLRDVYVCDDPNIIIEIQSNSSSTPAVGDIGSNADIVVGSGSTVTGLSGMELDQSTLTTSSAQLRIYDIVQSPTNTIGDYVKYRCLINEHFYKSTTGA